MHYSDPTQLTFLDINSTLRICVIFEHLVNGLDRITYANTSYVDAMELVQRLINHEDGSYHITMEQDDIPFAAECAPVFNQDAEIIGFAYLPQEPLEYPVSDSEKRLDAALDEFVDKLFAG